MGLDLIALQRDFDDGTSDWPGRHLDSRRADDDHPEVLKSLRETYDRNFSEEGMARSAEAEEWNWFEPTAVSHILLNIIFSPLYLMHLVVNNAAKRRDKARVIPTFDDWRAELCAKDPPPIVLQFGPDCPDEGIPEVGASVQFYGFRGQAVETRTNPLVEWWATQNAVDIDIMLYCDSIPDGPQETEDIAAIDELGSVSIGDMAALFTRIETDCAAAFPDLAAAAAVDSWSAEEFGPYPEQGLDAEASPGDLTAIRGAARFFMFWQGKGYDIAADF